MLINDSHLYKDFRDRIKDAKKKRNEIVTKRHRRDVSNTSSLGSLSEDPENENIIDRNINLMAHFKAYFLMKVKHMSEITN